MAVLVVRHLTKYRYRRPVRLGEHRMMFRPRDSFDQRLCIRISRFFQSHVVYAGSTTCSATASRFSTSTHSARAWRSKASFALITSPKMLPTFRLRSTQSFTHSCTVPSNCPRCDFDKLRRGKIDALRSGYRGSHLAEKCPSGSCPQSELCLTSPFENWVVRKPKQLSGETA